MNRKLEDAMVRLAFGDATPEEMSALEQEAARNPEAARSLAGYRRMREGLRELHDVPQDQLSKERLRHAILAQGLKPQSTQSQRTWLWMPAAAALLAFGFMMLKQNGSHQAPQIMVGSVASLEKNAPSFKSGLDVVPNFDRNPAPFTVETKPAENLNFGKSDPVRTAAKHRSHRSARHLTKSEAEGLIAGIMQNTSGDSYQPDQEPVASVADRKAAPTASTADTSASQPIVLIEGSKDSATGAQKATEVDSSKNVRTSG